MKPQFPRWKVVRLAFWVAAIFVLVAGSVRAAGPAQGTDENAICLRCHSDPHLKIELPDGKAMSLFVDATKYGNSVHGKQRLACVTCHTNIVGYPHPPLVASDRRDTTLRMYTLCRRCHEQEYMKTLDSIHARQLAGGNRNAPVCTDCHGSHYIAPPDKPRSRILDTCARCHSAIYNAYRRSVHGAALLGEGNPDVPTCIDCHGVHNIQSPLTIAFRLRSPEMCGRCHRDKALMSKYGISTDVFRTYVADFHGTTVELFQKTSPSRRPDEAVCFDCHGIHDISRPDSREGGIAMKKNLLKVCRKCHPGATSNFPGAWLSHYEPSPKRAALVYYTALFFKLLTISVLLALIAHIGLDFSRLVVKKIRSRGASR